MKIGLNFILSAIALLYSSITYADIIILKNGDTLNVFNVEVGKTNVFYSESADTDADSKRVPVSDVFAVKIGDGEMTTLITKDSPKNETKAEPSSGGSVNKAQPDKDNANIIAQYSHGEYSYQDKNNKTDKDAKAVLVFYRLTPESVLSSPELTASIEVGSTKEGKWQNFETVKKDFNNKFLQSLAYRISLYNKTNHPIYVDLSKSANSSNIIGSRTFYDATQVTEGGGKSSGIGVGVLGVGIGNSSGTSSSITKTQQAVIMIPPHGTVYLPGIKRYSEYYKKVFEEPQIFSYLNHESPIFENELAGIKQLEKRTFTPEDAFGTIDYMITYSDDEKLTESKVMNFSFYVHQVIGAKPGPLGIGYKNEISKVINIDDKTICGIINIKK